MTEPLKALISALPDLPQLSGSAPLVRRLALCSMCRAPVRVPGTYCDPCRPKAILASRISLLGDAFGSLPGGFEFAAFANDRVLLSIVGPDALDDAQQAVDAKRAVLIGPAGSGKTTLAIAMARSVLEVALAQECSVEQWRRAERLRFISAYDLGRAVAEHPLGQGTAPLVKTATEASLLVLDDLGAESKTHNSAVADVIYDRHAKDRQTIITTGFRSDSLAERYGDGIARRVFHGVLIEPGVLRQEGTP